MRDAATRFVATGPWPARSALAALLAVGRRPRGWALLGHAPALRQPVHAVLAMSRYDDPAVARTLGWDPAAVVARGRDLRRAEGRP